MRSTNLGRVWSHPVIFGSHTDMATLNSPETPRAIGEKPQVQARIMSYFLVSGRQFLWINAYLGRNQFLLGLLLGPDLDLDPVCLQLVQRPNFFFRRLLLHGCSTRLLGAAACAELPIHLLGFEVQTCHRFNNPSGNQSAIVRHLQDVKCHCFHRNFPQLTS